MGSVRVNVGHKVRNQLIFSRLLLAEPDHQTPTASGPLRLLCELMVAYGAAELGLAAICVQLDCVPDKKDPCLPDYLDSLTRAAHLASTAPGMDYVAELHKVRFEAQLRFRLPDPGRWIRAREEMLEHMAGWCRQFLGLSLLDLDSVATAALTREQTAISDPLTTPGQPRYNCVGSAEIRLAHRGQAEKGTISNLSAGGCYVKSELAPEIGDQVEMTLQVNKMSFRVGGNVVHTPPLVAHGEARGTDIGMGVHFNEMSAGARDRLQELIAELKMKANRVVWQERSQYSRGGGDAHSR